MISQEKPRNVCRYVGSHFILIAILAVLATSLAWGVLRQEAVPSESLKASASKSPGESTARLEATYGKLPLSFEANRGQTDSRVKFLSRGRGYTFFLTPEEAVMVLRSAPAAMNATHDPKVASKKFQAGEKPVKQTVLRMRMVGANPNPVVTGLDALPGKNNYFIGNDPEKWRTGVPNFAKVKYAGIYRGIDLVFHGNQRQLEYDFVVATGADPGAIRLDWKGAKRVEVDGRGDLVLHAGGGQVVHHAPVVYQEINGSRREIRGSYVLRGKDQVGFRVAAYDRDETLVIDPVLVYSTYLGGSDYDEPLGIAVDYSGSAYVTGATLSTNFPTANPFQAAHAGGYDAFVSKLNASGSALSYSTYLGGSGGSNRSLGISVDASGNAYVTGETDSTSFPTAGPLQAYAGGGDAFVTKLNPAGAALSYSTYLGGSLHEIGNAIAVDGSGNAYVTGNTASTNFPTASPLQAAKAGINDGFVAKINASGSALTYSTYLGGSSTEESTGIAVDGSGNAYVTGNTASTNFPTASPLQAAKAGANDGFVAKINASGSALTYSTYLGGSGYDEGDRIAVDASGNAYVAGVTSSTDFPTASPVQAAIAEGPDAFVAKLNPAGSALSYSTYLGGSAPEVCRGIAVDASGNAYVAGVTSSTDFPTANPLQSANAGIVDVFVTKLNPAGSALSYSTYLGGSIIEHGNGIAVDASGNTYVTGDTSSTNFPTTVPLQAANAGGYDAFVVKIGDESAQIPTLGAWGAGLLVLGLLAAGRRALRRW